MTLDPNIFTQIREALDKGQVLYAVFLGRQGALSQTQEAAAAETQRGQKDLASAIAKAQQVYEAAEAKAKAARDAKVGELRAAYDAIAAEQEKAVALAQGEAQAAEAALRAHQQDMKRQWGVDLPLFPSPTGGGHTRI